MVFSLPSTILPNKLYLGGTWNISEEFAENTSANASIVFTFNAQNVYMVASATLGVHAIVLLDGKTAMMDTNDTKQGSITFKEDRLYHVIKLPTPGIHTLEIKIENPGLQAFTFTFG
jgi:hypothetical protein